MRDNEFSLCTLRQCNFSKISIFLIDHYVDNAKGFYTHSRSFKCKQYNIHKMHDTFFTYYSEIL